MSFSALTPGSFPTGCRPTSRRSAGSSTSAITRARAGRRPGRRRGPVTVRRRASPPGATPPGRRSRRPQALQEARHAARAVSGHQNRAQQGQGGGQRRAGLRRSGRRRDHAGRRAAGHDQGDPPGRSDGRTATGSSVVSSAAPSRPEARTCGSSRRPSGSRPASRPSKAGAPRWPKRRASLPTSTCPTPTSPTSPNATPTQRPLGPLQGNRPPEARELRRDHPRSARRDLTRGPAFWRS